MPTMEDKVLTLIRNSRLERIADELTGLLRYAISMQTQATPEEELPPGVSKLGGLPDLPPEQEWPMNGAVPLSFIAQIRLADIAPYDRHDELPHTGMLSFFFNDAALESYPPTPEDWRVIYYDGDLSTLSRRPAPQEDLWIFSPCSVTFSSRLTLPPFDSAYIERLGLTYEAYTQERNSPQRQEVDAYYQLNEELDKLYSVSDPIHQLLGHPFQVQGDIFRECQRDFHYAGDSTDLQLLLQIDTDDQANMMWGDAGMLYFCIPRQALAARDFSQVMTVMQCC